MKGFTLKSFEKAITTSRVQKTSLVGDQNEIIPPAEWDLGEGSELLKAGKGHLHHPHTDLMFEHILEHFVPKRNTVVFTNCTAKKPYSTSRTYSTIISGTKPYEHHYDLVTISSIGVIPSEYEKYYPFAHYAWDDGHSTKSEIKEEFQTVISERVRRFLEKNTQYKYIIGVFRVSSKGKRALKAACEALGRELIEIPSAIAFEKMKDNCVKMNTFQLTNNDTLGELNDVLKELFNGNHVGARQSWTKEKVHEVVSARMKLRRKQRMDLKAQGFTSEQIDEQLYGKKPESKTKRKKDGEEGTTEQLHILP
jgi:predicted RNA-binding protein